MEGLLLNMLEDKQNKINTTSIDTHEDDWLAQLSASVYPKERIDELPTSVNLRAVNIDWSHRNELEIQYSWAIDEMATWILPVVSVEHTRGGTTSAHATANVGVGSHISLLLSFIKTSGIYALASVVLPLITLVLAPFLTHYLSPTDYGVLTILNTFISLGAGITQLGLSSAFFRAYSYDYSSDDDRRDVLATSTSLLCLISIPTVIGAVFLAPFLADVLFGRSLLGSVVGLALVVILLQNLTVPGFAWMRAEGRAHFYSSLSISSLLITLFANLVLVGRLHMGIAGALIATGSGYASVIICTIPIIVVRAGIRIRVDITKSMLAYGLPLVFNLVSYWVLQLSDRYLLSLFGSLAQTARYAAAYTLGSAMLVVVMGPFTLAWPTTMFAIAKRKDALQIFKLVFRWFSLFLLFAAFGLSFVGTILLDLLFPVSYHSAASVIPVVAVSIAFYGVYYVFMTGANVVRKTWLAAVFMTIAAIVNVVLNLFLIPHYQAMGAAASTLIAYVVLALVAYIVNQRIYPLSFEIGRFMFALLVGMALYSGSSFLASFQGIFGACGIYGGALALYGLCLVILARLPAWRSYLGEQKL
jgi:O-antigen/teichoic acid export membrane protein